MFFLANERVAPNAMLSLEDAEARGIFSCSEINGFHEFERRKNNERLLDACGERVGNHWQLRHPTDEISRKAWAALIASEVVLDFSGFESDSIEQVVRSFRAPIVFALPMGGLEGDWEPFIKGRLRSEQNSLHLVCAGVRGKYCIVGGGDKFRQAVEIADAMPGSMHAYPASAAKSIIATRKMLFGRPQ